MFYPSIVENLLLYLQPMANLGDRFKELVLVPTFGEYMVNSSMALKSVCYVNDNGLNDLLCSTLSSCHPVIARQFMWVLQDKT
jgi:hypothetical protein